MAVVVVVLAVLVAGLGALAVHQHGLLRDVRVPLRLPPDPAVGQLDVIVIVIHNPHEVAASRNPLARGLTALSPGLVRSLVHRETIREVRAQLEAEGIDADVRVGRVLSRDSAG